MRKNQLVRRIDERVHRKAGTNRGVTFFSHRKGVPLRVVNCQSNKLMIAPPKAFRRAAHMTEAFCQCGYIPDRFFLSRNKSGSNSSPIAILDKQEISLRRPIYHSGVRSPKGIFKILLLNSDWKVQYRPEGFQNRLIPLNNFVVEIFRFRRVDRQNQSIRDFLGRIRV